MKNDLNEALEKLQKAGLIVEYTSMYSGLFGFSRYLKTAVKRTGHDLETEETDNFIIVKFGGKMAKVTLEKFDEDEDPMLYVEAGGDERAFYNEHSDWGSALKFIIKKICPTNESVNESDDPYTIMYKKLEELENELLIQGFKAKLIDRPGAFHVKVDSPSYGPVQINYSIKDKSYTISNYEEVFRTYKEQNMTNFDSIVEFLA